jgi:hypothetical protein
VPDDKGGTGATIGIAPGVAIDCGMSALDGSVEVGIHHDDREVRRERIAPEDPPKKVSVDLGVVELELEVGADNEEGEIDVSGRVVLENPLGDGRKTLHEVKKCVPYAPAHGSVGGRSEPDPPIFDDPRFGRSRMSSKKVTRVFVDERPRLLADVGRVVKETLWPDCEPWVFNTVACVGDFDSRGRGTYSDPTSPWFNVFLGYYQIDAPKPSWKRPFAYESADGGRSQVRFDEIVRLAKSDWNYISNWMYGVPSEVAERHNDFDVDRLRLTQRDAGVIGQSHWHRVEIGGVEFVSVYEADRDGAERLVSNSLVSNLWRDAFGKPNPRDDHPDSFIPTVLDGDLYIAYWEDDEAFHTVMFGGTAPANAPKEFLARQLAEARRVIERSFGDTGFGEGPVPGAKEPETRQRRERSGKR